MELISSRSNPKVKFVRSLRQRKQREATGWFIVEGIHPVGEALEAGAQLHSLYYAPQRLNSLFASSLVERCQESGADVHALAADVFESIAEKDNPQGLLAVVRLADVSLAQLNPGNFPWGVALVSPQDPGNVGTILRTIDAVGASGLLLLDNSVDPRHPACVRASMGALFHYPLAQASFAEFSAWAARHGYHLYGTSARASLDYREIQSYRRPAILLLGSEREGLNTEQQQVCEGLVRLPMRGRVTSLNLAVAAGVLLYEMLDKMQ